MNRRCWAEISPAALRHNARALLARAGHAAGMMAIVKANAYGHGVETAVQALEELATMFGVANAREAERVREVAREKPVFILGPALPEEREWIVRAGFIPSVSTLDEARDFDRLARAQGRASAQPIHLVLDTGMGRIGVWEEEAASLAREIVRLPGVTIAGIASHLPVADEDDEFTATQLARFTALASELRSSGSAEPVLHIENSAGVIGFPAHVGDLFRAGLALYGSSPRPEFQPALQPVLTWKTRVTLVRDVGAGRGISYGRTFITPAQMRVATLAVGYADGFQRHLTGSGMEVLIGGRRRPLLGRVTMDQIVVDVSQAPEVHAGDEVVLLGRQGEEEILAAEMAQKAGTIAWEIFTGLGPRVERVVIEAE